VQVEMVMVPATVTDVMVGTVPAVVSIILKPFLQLLVVSILFVLVVFIVVVLENVQDAKDVLLTSTDITFPTSVPLAVQEVVRLTTGVEVVLPRLKDAAFNQVHGVETLQWVTTSITNQNLMVSIVTVTTTKVFQLVLLSLEPWELHPLSESVLSVAVAGQFLMDTVVKVVSILVAVVESAVRVVLVDLVSLRSLSSDTENNNLIKEGFYPLFL